MKFIFSILLICSSYFSFGQMTLSELMRVYNMDMDQFETYAIGKGYEFSSFKKGENVNGISYVKGVGKDTKYIKLYDNWYSEGSLVQFQTSVSSEIVNIKNQLKSIGFKLCKSEFLDDNEGTQVKKYRNNKFEIRIYTTPPNDNTFCVVYEINLSKY